MAGIEIIATEANCKPTGYKQYITNRPRKGAFLWTTSCAKDSGKPPFRAMTLATT